MTLTLPGDWRGGRVGDGYIFTSHRADCTVTFDDGLIGIPMTEAGTRTFLVERLAAKVESTSTLAFGRWKGAGGVGTTATTRNYFGQFIGPRGAVWTQLTTRGRTSADADALWQAVTTGVR